MKINDPFIFTKSIWYSSVTMNLQLLGPSTVNFAVDSTSNPHRNFDVEKAFKHVTIFRHGTFDVESRSKFQRFLLDVEIALKMTSKTRLCPLDYNSTDCSVE